MVMDPNPDASATGNQPLESTTELLGRVRSGDERALNTLVNLFWPRLQRWAHGRLPAGARSLSDTEDLVQITLIRVLKQLDGFEPRHPGAFLSYLRRSYLNNLRNEIRAAGRRPTGEPPLVELPDPAPSPLELAIGQRVLETYEAALEELNEDQRAAVILRIELGYKHREIAELLDSPTANAARMLVSRGLVRLTELMKPEGIGDEG